MGFYPAGMLDKTRILDIFQLYALHLQTHIIRDPS
jgi:hypothetical protein